MFVVISVAVFGALGASSRYSIDALVERHTESDFPWATFTINIAGCLAVGYIIAALVDRHRAPHWLRIGLVMRCGHAALRRLVGPVGVHRPLTASNARRKVVGGRRTA